MRIFANFMRLLVGLAVLSAAAGIPAYFTSVDKSAVVAAGKGTPTPVDLARLYLDSSKISAAVVLADAAAEGDAISKDVSEAYKKHPSWRIAGGDAPYFSAFLSTIDASKYGGGTAVYGILSLGENRAKLLEFLSETQSEFVKRILALRGMTSALLPPVFGSAGAPLDAALLTTALLAQSGDFPPDFLKSFSATLNASQTDPAEKERLEKYCLGVLVLSKKCDWVLLRSIFARFSEIGEVYDFAKLCGDSPDDFKLLAAAAISGCGVADSIKYLSDPDRRRDFAFAYMHGEGAAKFLLSADKPIYRDSYAAKIFSPALSPIREFLGGVAARHGAALLSLKIFLSIIGGYMAVRGAVRIFSRRRDTPSWRSPLALGRGLLEGAMVSLFVFLAFEPDAFKIKIESAENTPAPELKFAFEKVVNTIGEETMKFESDSATLAAVGLFFVMQFTVYLVSLIRLAAIKRTVAPAKLKLKLLENEDNLFDLGLYIGLAGTVVSLVLLTMGIVTASLMAAYASTLFGILFTATIKIGHVRGYRRKLLIEAENED